MVIQKNVPSIPVAPGSSDEILKCVYVIYYNGRNNNSTVCKCGKRNDYFMVKVYILLFITFHFFEQNKILQFFIDSTLQLHKKYILYTISFNSFMYIDKI